MQYYENHKIIKKLGQHFLCNETIINKIVEIINPRSHDVFFEIGPGLGAITVPMSYFCNFINVIELDKDLILRLKNNSFLKNRLKFFHKNVLDIDFNYFFKNIRKPLRIFGNLPYNISIPILFHFFKYTDIIYDMHFMFQKEVAERICAIINNRKYGKLSVLSQYYFEIENMMYISKNNFIPVPKVDSCFLYFKPIKKRNFKVNNIMLFYKVLKKAFSHRRKMLHNNLKTFLSILELKSLGISGFVRAESVSLRDYCTLTNFIDSKYNRNIN